MRYLIQRTDPNIERFLVVDLYLDAIVYEGDFQDAIDESWRLNRAEIEREPKTSVPSIQQRDPTIRRIYRREPHEMSAREWGLWWDDPDLYWKARVAGEFNEPSVRIVRRKEGRWPTKSTLTTTFTLGKT